MLRFTCKWTQVFLPQRFFLFKTSTVLLPTFCKYHVVFQDHSEDYIGEDGIINMIKVNRLVYKFTIRYVVFKELHHRKYCEQLLFPCRFSSLRIVRLISSNTKDDLSGFKFRINRHLLTVGSFQADFLHGLIFCATFSCNSMPRGVCSALHGVNPNLKKKSRRIKNLKVH